MGIIDNQGRIFKRINIIDFCIILIILFVAPVIYFSQKIFNEPQQPYVAATTYLITKHCPICEAPYTIEIEKGRQPPTSYTELCQNCGNVVEFIKAPIIVDPLPDNADYEQEYYKKMLEILNKK